MKKQSDRRSLFWYLVLGLTLAALLAGCLGMGVTALAAEEEESEIHNAYLYTQEDGMPKYWLDFTGAVTDNLILHCYFRSGDPTFYETFYILDWDTAEEDGDYTIVIKNVYDSEGRDISDWFESLTLTMVQGSILMNVQRDEKTPAGGSEDNLLTGVYPMDPMDAGVMYEYRLDDGQLKYWMDLDGEDIELHAMFRSGDPEYYEEVFTLDMDSAEWDGDYTAVIKEVYDSEGNDVSDWFESLTLTEVQGAILMDVQRDESTLAGGADDNILTDVYLLEPRTYLIPLSDGPFTPEELASMAQRCYFENSGFYPPEADVEDNGDGTFTIHLYEVVDLGEGDTHTATSAWYTVDEYGVGTDDIYSTPVDLAG